ncbi:hypothetical protein [Algoriphagus litoralis]|uniref:hypothetical protein n=1 Tax=Algoriphagus litoralis TaxID=2202829 RepID=UPI000DBAC3C7|nr:hypothetical protein [Algoriphagus litoralis]
MSKNYFLVLVLLLLSVSFACVEQTDEDPLDVYREIAYNALPSDVRATVIGEYQDAEVSAWVDGNYLVIFQTSDQALGPVKVVVDPVLGVMVEILPRP